MGALHNFFGIVKQHIALVWELPVDNALKNQLKSSAYMGPRGVPQSDKVTAGDSQLRDAEPRPMEAL